MAFIQSILPTNIFQTHIELNQVDYVSSFIKNDLGLTLLSNKSNKFINDKLKNIKTNHKLTQNECQSIFSLCKSFLKRNRIIESDSGELELVYDFMEFIDHSLTFADNNGISNEIILKYFKVLMIRPFVNSIDERMCFKLFGEIGGHLANKFVTEKEFQLYVEKISDSIFCEDFMGIFYFFNSLQITQNSIQSNLETLDKKIQIEKKLQIKNKI